MTVTELEKKMHSLCQKGYGEAEVLIYSEAPYYTVDIDNIESDGDEIIINGANEH